MNTPDTRTDSVSPVEKAPVPPKSPDSARTLTASLPPAVTTTTATEASSHSTPNTESKDEKDRLIENIRKVVNILADRKLSEDERKSFQEQIDQLIAQNKELKSEYERIKAQVQSSQSPEKKSRKREVAFYSSVAALLLFLGRVSSPSTAQKTATHDPAPIPSASRINPPAEAERPLPAARDVNTPAQSVTPVVESLELPALDLMEFEKNTQGVATTDEGRIIVDLLLRASRGEALTSQEMERISMFRERNIAQMNQQLEALIYGRQRIAEQRILAKTTEAERDISQRKSELQREISVIRSQLEQSIRLRRTDAEVRAAALRRFTENMTRRSR